MFWVLLGGVFLDLSPIWFVIASALAGIALKGLEVRGATEHNVTLFTALDTLKVLLDVLEETTLTISTIDA